MKEFITIGYKYSELSETAKEAVKRWYLDDPTRNDIFYENIIEELKAQFPRSNLDVTYSLSCCQGDGLNIEGVLNLFDFLEIWTASPEERATMEYYLENTEREFIFEKNTRYGYSCKFIDKKYIGDIIDETLDDLIFNGIERADRDLITRFFSDMLDYFEKLDKDFENRGYTYLYEIGNDELSDICDDCGYYFTESGEFVGCGD